MNAATAVYESDARRYTPRSLRILVADDDRDTVLSLTMLLESEGHEVRGVSESEKVIPAVHRLRPDAVILDIVMPGQSGYALAHAIRTQYKGTRPLLIGISGQYKRGPDVLLSQVAGFDHYLLKPYAPDALLALLKPLQRPPHMRRDGT